jgi:hypothetical protein
LDQAISSLDSVSERLVQEAQECLTRVRTSFVMEHHSAYRPHRRPTKPTDCRAGFPYCSAGKNGVNEHLWSLQFADFEVLEVENTPV